MIRKLAVTATQVKATVVIGTDEYGGYVATDVVLNRKAEDVADALASIENLLLRNAQTHVRTSRDRAELDQLVAAGIAAKVDKERQRIKADAEAAAEGRRRDVANAEAQWERKAANYERTIVRLQDDNRDLQTRLQSQRGTS